MTFQGNDGCPCTNVSAILASVPDRQCRLSPGGITGVRLSVDGSCVPFSFGSSQCLQHDLLFDSACRVDAAGDAIVPAYCFRSWCYVDFETCRKASHERAYRSSYFPFETGVDVFYSYSTCNSTAEDWLEVVDDIVGDNEALGGIAIAANVPTYYVPSECPRRATSSEVFARGGGDAANTVRLVSLVRFLVFGDVQEGCRRRGAHVGWRRVLRRRYSFRR